MTQGQFEQIADPAAAMDRMYRRQRYIYDLTRKYYLLGRDTLVKRMLIRPGDRVLEVGCGTARNLIAVKRAHPAAQCFGLDASEQMLRTARANIARAGVSNVTLRVGLAQQLDHRAMFGLNEPFDLIYFSYSLSMIPPWREAMDAALANLRPGGTVWVVDFWDQADLPRWFAALLTRWLRRFGVHHRPELIDHLHIVQRQGFNLQIQPIARRYAFLASLTSADTAGRLREGEMDRQQFQVAGKA